jgi:hypothetical protein
MRERGESTEMATASCQQRGGDGLIVRTKLRPLECVLKDLLSRLVQGYDLTFRLLVLPEENTVHTGAK